MASTSRPRQQPWRRKLSRERLSRDAAGTATPEPRGHDRAVLGLALLSRVVVLLTCLASDLMLPDHAPDASVAGAPAGVPSALGAFARWDAARFLALAARGYEGEESYAFFPLLPLIIGTVARGAATVLGVPSELLLVLVGIIFTNGCFVLAAWLLYRLACELLGDRQWAFATVKIFCLTPANVFMSSVYTESPYAACTFAGLLLMRLDCRTGASVVFALGTGFRSNGILNCGFVIHDSVLKVLALWRRNSGCRTLQAIWGSLLQSCLCFLSCGIIVMPYVALLLYAASRECGVTDPPVWCSERLPNVYSYVQATYWQVGPFQYWQLRQLPNFLLAAPSLLLAGAFSLQELLRCARLLSRAHEAVRAGADRTGALAVALASCPLLPHALHCGALGSFLLFCANVQVATRVLAAASPCLHMFLASLLLRGSAAAAAPASRDGGSARGRAGVAARRMLWTYIVAWNVIGCIMHPNSLPWT
eukprot:TRINITY_DN28480_c0_g2_i1.p1 TRINITY_DN28480_c0_g2~~TRINITY_DN28480_c0_g2_i1.p1  ORF type:complete len:497 (-),score=68.83 TRINITY_DN28480_c0_g2_i1:283-1716(-)